jgi:serine/threonine protein kinase/nitrite reductase/ring-hydroxylating ferredoxin subunit
MVDRLALNGLMGTVIGNYRVERPLEQGESGMVFQVSDKAGARYLMRFVGDLMAEGARDIPAAARLVFLAHFQQEAKLIAMLRHPHILPLLDYGNFHSLPYLVYPQSAGSSLLEILSTQGPLSLADAGQYLQQITSALDYAHQHAVLHRNLSVACISIQPGTLQYGGQSASLNGQESFGRVLLGELGYRRIIELSRVDLQTESGTLRRRPAYDGSSEASAPEQLLGQPIDTYTDVYACGVLLYRLLTGHAPFEGAARDEVARQHLYAQIPSVYAWRKDAPARLNEVLKKALAKDPSHRYRRPGELAQAYQDAMQPLAMPVPTPTEIVSSRLSTARVQPGVSRRRVLALVGAGGGVVAVSIFAGMRLLEGQQVSSTAPPTSGVPQATVAQNLPRAAQAGRPGTGSANNVLMRASDLPANSAMTFPIANHQRPGVLVHLSDNRFVAFDSTCTHAGCGVEYNAQTRLLECPCHDAAFDPAQKAAVVSGPAQSPLTSINIQVNSDGTISLK